MIRHLYVLGSHEKASHEKAYADSSMSTYLRSRGLVDES